MGRRGPKPKPTTFKILHGNPGKRALNDDEPQPDIGVPEQPPGLSESAKQAWDYFVELLLPSGVLTVQDGPVLALLSMSWASHMDAYGKVQKGGAVWLKPAAPGELPTFAYSPYWVEANKEHKKLTQLLSEFGIGPASRSGVKVGKQQNTGVMTRKRA